MRRRRGGSLYGAWSNRSDWGPLLLFAWFLLLGVGLLIERCST